MDDDEYDIVKRKPLKLKRHKDDQEDGKKKQRSKDKSNSQDLSHLPEVPADPNKVIITTTTKAEEAFRSKQGKIAEGRILRKAAKTHKQRVEEFNKHLDSLSEHYDIPKVSWTK